jgi:hypothetical protein
LRSILPQGSIGGNSALWSEGRYPCGCYTGRTEQGCVGDGGQCSASQPRRKITRIERFSPHLFAFPSQSTLLCR